jgi:hypothetical protein
VHKTNTGPKGVLNDAAQHRTLMALQRQAEAVRNRELLKRQCVTVRPAGESDSEEDEDEED